MKEVFVNTEALRTFVGEKHTDMRGRFWKEHQKQRTITTPDGPVFAYEGEVVVVAVVKNSRQAAALLAALDEGGKA